MDGPVMPVVKKGIGGYTDHGIVALQAFKGNLGLSYRQFMENLYRIGQSKQATNSVKKYGVKVAHMPSPVYYISQATIDQMYQDQYGRPETVEVSESVETSGGFRASVNVGLNRLLQIVLGGGANIEGAGSVDQRSTTSETRISESTKKARAIDMVRDLLQSDSIPDISEFDSVDNSHTFYSFHCPIHLSVEGSSDINLIGGIREGSDEEGVPVMIRATHASEHRYFTGVTSPENWISTSVILNFIEPRHTVNSTETTLAGILHPTNIMGHEPPRITVQYLFLCPSNVYQMTLED